MRRFGSPEALAWLGTNGVHANSVELKTLLVPPAEAAAEALTGRCAPTWSVRRMYLLDTVDLDLVRAGVEIRLRRRARGRYDLAVSARRSGIARERIIPRNVRVELDIVPGALWQDIEDRCEVGSAAAAEVIAGSAASQELLSATQRSWACCGGNEAVDDAQLRELRVHGPLVVHRVKVNAQRLGLRRADLELYRYPSGRELLELSTRCWPQDVLQTATAFEQLLDERDVVVAPGHRTKASVWQDEIGIGRAS
ncbi:hypothetical protein [Pseudonocardia sp. 73-21]|nr:hypothetical protein [Pseudonocardia sp. 73-21]MBN9102431.1 hypothetical protein [Pseudonocardia sp.]